jgi:hypothetical protein
VDLKHDEVRTLLSDLISKLEENGITAIIQVFGGSAIGFYHHDRQSTQDIDSYIYPPTVILDIASEIAKSIPNLQDSWINNSVAAVLPPVEDKKPALYYESKNIRVTLASEEYLLAMKAMTDRQLYKDKVDAAMLFNSLSLQSVADIAAIVKEYYLDTGNQTAQMHFWDEIVALAETMPKSADKQSEFQRSLSQLRSDSTQKDIGNTFKPCKGIER